MITADAAEATDTGRTVTHDSALVSGGTALARVTGVVRVVVISAVLGPTTSGNAFQIANSLPNLVYYGFLAGSLVSSLLVPALVRQLVSRRPEQVSVVARGFLGLAVAAGAAAMPVMVLGLPLLVHLALFGASAASEGDQVRMIAVLAALTAPQIVLYGIAGTGAAVMYAHRRFALPACAPALENVGMILVFGIWAAVHGAAPQDGTALPTGELLVLGLGATGAVCLHAGLQWWGAFRCGVTLLPARGWVVPEVRAIVGRGVRSMSQAGMLAVQTIAMLVVMSRVPGGVVGLQVALNFYFLPIALIATPVGLALLPRLARLRQAGDLVSFWETYAQGVMLAVFLVLPASIGYLLLARPLADAVAVGNMATAGGVDLVAGALGMLSLGLLGAAVFFISTQACYACEEARRPLRSMTVQTVTSLSLIGLAVALAPERDLVRAVAAAYAVGCTVGAVHLFLTLTAGARSAVHGCLRALGRVAAGTLVMLPVVMLAALVVPHLVPGRLGSVLTVLAGSAAGALAYGVTQVRLGAPELAWLRSVAGRRAGSGLEVGVS